MSTDLAVADVGAEIARQQEEEFDNELFVTPILKIGQPLTREVEQEQAEAGEFINTLTGDTYGKNVEFIVAYYNKGRFAADRDSGRAFVSFDQTIPANWADLLGEEYVGTPFSEHPEAEEGSRARLNRKEITEWGKGPQISTTHNFTGLAIVPGVEGEEDDLAPVRLSLQRTNVPAAKKLLTLKRAMLRGKPFWDVVFDLSTYKKSFSQGSAHLLNVKQGRTTSAEERQAAVELAQAVSLGNIRSNEDEAVAGDAPVEPDAKGGADF
jgi:hypothetical protein